MIRQKPLSARQIQSLDKLAIEKVGIPSLSLMENAGCAVTREVLWLLRPQKKSVAVICGCGNNGGDGFVVVRHLMNAGIKVSVFLVGAVSRLSRDAAVQYQILRHLKVKIQVVRKVDRKLTGILKRCGVIVDAVFGVGLNRALKEPHLGVVAAVNSSKVRVVAVDVPSGLDATTGQIYGDCIKANVTVTFSAAKKGFTLKEGRHRTGRVRIADIGIPRNLLMKIK